MIKTDNVPSNSISQQFSEIVKELGSLSEVEMNERIKTLTKFESVSHYDHLFNPSDRSRFMHDQAMMHFYRRMIGHVKELDESAIINEFSKPRIGILLDKRTSKLSVIPTRIPTLNNEDFLLFNYSEDSEDLYKFFYYLMNDELLVPDDETINRFFKLRIDVINTESDKEKLKLLKLLKRRAVNQIKKLARYYTSINLHDFDRDSPFSDNWLSKSYYRVLYCYISDSLASYSSELRQLNLSNLSFYNQIWVRKELKRMERYGYFSKKKYIPKPFIISGVGYLIEG